MEELAKFFARLLKLTIASVVIGSVTLLAVVVMHWDKAPPHGWHLVKDTPEASEETSAEGEAPPPHRVVHHRPRRVSAPPPVVVEEETRQAAPVVVRVAPAPAPVAPVVVVVVAAPAEEKHFTAHHKGRGGCDGDLIFTDASLRFDCPSQPGGGLNFERAAVVVDDDGIRAYGRGYHFKIPGMDKPQARTLFAAWVERGVQP